MTLRRIIRGPAVVLIGMLVAVLLAPVAAAQAQTSTTGGGSQTVAYRGVQVTVPSTWAVVDLGNNPNRCVLFNTPALYLGVQGPNANCPASAVGVTAAAQLRPPAQNAPAPGTAVEDAVAHRIDATSASGQVEATLSYDATPGEVSALLAQLDATKIVSAPQPAPKAVAPAVTPAARPAAAPAAPAAAAPAARPAAAAAAPAASQVTPTLGFDTCAAPSVSTMASWYAASPYRTAGIYLGGINAACGHGNLSASWITSVAEQGWSFIPTYVGLQAPCVDQSGLQMINPAMAAAQGQSAADDAISQATGLGLRAGTPIYFDSEAYNNTVAGCTQAVLTFLSAWTAELHAYNYVAGVYGSSSSTIFDLASATSTPGVAEPDDIWIANWNNNPAVFGDRYVSDGLWSQDQRLHQYQGGHTETWGGVTIDIDNDSIDGATAIAGNGPPGSLQVFAATTFGQLLTGWQFAPGKPFDPWQGLQVPVAVNDSPSVGVNHNGSLLLLAHTSANQLLLSWQGGPSRDFGGWVDMGLDGGLASKPAVALDGNGHAQIVAETVAGQVVTTWQSQQDGPFGGWLDLGLPGSAVGGASVGVEGNGGLQVLVRTTDRRLLTSWQAAPGQPFGGWLDLGLDGEVLGGPVAGRSPSGALSVFAVIGQPGSSLGRLVTAWQAAPDQPFGGWLDLGMPASEALPPAVALDADGGLQILATTVDGRLLTSWQLGPDQPFGGWLDLGLDGAIGSTASAALNTDGRMELFVRSFGRVLTSWQATPNGPFGGWLDLGLPGSVVGTPQVAVNRAGASG